MGTVHRLADRRTDRASVRLSGGDPATAPDREEAAEWKLLAERAGHVLGALEAAAEGRRRPGLAALAAEAAGLRAALEAATSRQIAVKTLLGDAYRVGLADGQARAPETPGGGR